MQKIGAYELIINKDFYFTDKRREITVSSVKNHYYIVLFVIPQHAFI